MVEEREVHREDDAHRGERGPSDLGRQPCPAPSPELGCGEGLISTVSEIYFLTSPGLWRNAAVLGLALNSTPLPVPQFQSQGIDALT